MKYDIRLNRTVRMEGNDLSNPILASWITAFIRSVIGETLHNIQKLEGKVVSVTTDGFITDIVDLEKKLLNLPSSTTNLLNMFRKGRKDLFGDPTGYEKKKEGVGISSWTTRGQFSTGGGGNELVASTGFQRHLYSMEEMDKLLREGLKSDNKEVIYINKRLRSALDIYKRGGHVTVELKDQTFRLFFDNRRLIITTEKENGVFNFEENKWNLLDSKPLEDVEMAELHRYIGKRPYEKHSRIFKLWKIFIII